jgi:hypothetical protein
MITKASGMKISEGTDTFNHKDMWSDNFELIDASLVENANNLSSMRDPLAYLNSVEILCKFSARGFPIDNTVWLQGFSINEATNELYLAIQGTGGTTLKIEIRDLQGNFKESKSFPIESTAYSESLPFFYNTNNELCFVVQTTVSSTRSIYNYTTGTLGTPFAVNGNAKMSVDGSYFFTCDATVTTMKTIYVYDWASIKSGTPILVTSFRVTNYGATLFEKIQGLVVNNGYIFMTQGASGGNPAITVYNTAGEMINGYSYTKESVGNAINTYYPGDVPDVTSYDYENESGWVYRGKLVTAQIINQMVYLFVHNSPTGVALETKSPIYRIDTDWLSVTMLNGAVTYASDTTPRIRRIGNQIMLDGAIKGLGATLNVEVLEFTSSYAPDRNFQVPQITSSSFQCNWQIQPNARAKILNSKNTPLDASTWYPFHITWFI